MIFDRSTSDAAPAGALFGKAQLAVLCALFGADASAKNLREIGAGSDCSASAISAAADSMAMAGIIVEERISRERWFRANLDSPAAEPLRALLKALPAALPVDIPSESIIKNVQRKSEKLGLSAPWDWSNPDISDDALIIKTAESLRFDDVVKICGHYGVDKVRRVMEARPLDQVARTILDRQLRNIEAAVSEISADQPSRQVN